MSELTSLSAGRLVTLLRGGDVSAREVVEAFIRRIEAVNPQINALVVDRFSAARQEANLADELRAAGQPLGLLHGLPVTIKEMFDVAGMPTTVGMATRRGRIASRDAEVVRRWRAAGAIVLGKTNVPQLGMYAESDNPVYGRTNNPWNVERTPGGSSGGEAALIAAGGSVLGMGSDGGGSIRLPGHFCGVCGFKPTGGRFPLQGHWMSANWPADWAQPGPMARNVDDLWLGIRAMVAATPTEAVYGEVPLGCGEPRDLALRGIRIGLFEQVADLPPCEAARRAAHRAAAALAELGAEIVPFEIPQAALIWATYMAIFYAEGLRDMQRQLRGSPIDPRIREYLRLARLPLWSRPLLAHAADAAGQRHVAASLRALERPVLSAERYTQRLMEMHGLRQHFGRALRRAQVDLLIGPAGPVPAFCHREFYANYSLIYTGVFNLLGVPAGVVPVTRVADVEAIESAAGGDNARDWVERALRRATQGSAGLPIGVQVVGGWWQDAAVLDLMGVLHSRLEHDQDFPQTPVTTAAALLASPRPSAARAN